ncbi:MAG TPA: sigma-70 family RNA polymerase sigma factor [Gemmataceae bacterium]
MTTNPTAAPDRFVRRLAATYRGDGREDAELLRRFAGERDEAAFAQLVSRHGPMVLGVCRRVTGDAHAAEDAFQATFLVLARKAASLERPEALAGWLHGVALRCARKARGAADRLREAGPEPGGRESGDPGAELARRELARLLDEEVGRLPAKYRVPVVLCYLEGRSYADAARELGCPLGTVAVRLSRARDLLRARLGRRGVGAASAALAGLLAEGSLAAAVPPGLAVPVVEAAARVAAGQSAAGVLPPAVVALAKGVVSTMWLSKLKCASALLLAAGLAGAVVTAPLLPLGAEPAPGQPKQPADPGKPAPKDRAATDQDRLQGTWKIVSARDGGRGGPIPEGSRMVFDGNKAVMYQGNRPHFNATFTLDPAANPKRIDFTDGKKTNLGIYKLDGKKLTLCLNEREERPTRFASEANSPNDVLMELAFVGKEPGKENENGQEQARLAERERLQGTWKVLEFHDGGEQDPVPEGSRLVITGDKLVLFKGDHIKISARFVLNVAADPKWIDILDGGETHHAIYKLEGKKLTICLSEDDGQRPTKFASDDGVSPNDELMVFEFAGKEKEGVGEQAARAERERLQGTWQVVSVEDNGRPKRQDVEDATLIIAGDKMTLKRGDIRETMGAFVINPRATPMSIDLTVEGRTMPGIVELKGDELKLCLNEQPGGARPTKFASEANPPNDLLMVLKRKKE